MTDPDKTANLVGQLTQGYREHKAEEAEPETIAVPGRVLGTDIEDQADELAAAAARLSDLLTAFARELSRSLDAIASLPGIEPERGVDGGRGRRAAPPGMVRPRG